MHRMGKAARSSLYSETVKGNVIPTVILTVNTNDVCVTSSDFSLETTVQADYSITVPILAGCSPETIDSKNGTVALSKKQVTNPDRKSSHSRQTISSLDRSVMSSTLAPTKSKSAKLTNQTNTRKQHCKRHQNVAEFGVSCPVNAIPVDSTRPHTRPLNPNPFRVRPSRKPPWYRTAQRYYWLEWLIHLDTVFRMTR